MGRLEMSSIDTTAQWDIVPESEYRSISAVNLHEAYRVNYGRFVATLYRAKYWDHYGLEIDWCDGLKQSTSIDTNNLQTAKDETLRKVLHLAKLYPSTIWLSGAA